MVAFPLRKSFCALLLLLTTFAANAQESSVRADGEIRTRLPGVLRNKKFEDANILTDPKMRADQGSLSRYSFKGNLIYRGPSLGDPTAADQPNPDGAVGNYAQALKGMLTTRYRLNPTDAISAGTGIVLNHPFHGMDRVDAKDPFIAYDTSFRVGDVQIRSSPGFVLTTTPELNRVGQTSGFMYVNSMVRRFPTTRWALAMDSFLSYWFYSRSYRAGKPKAGGDGLAQEYSINLIPQIKYSLSDKFETFLGYSKQWYNPRMIANRLGLWAKPDAIRPGLAYAYNREVYVAAFLEAYPAIMKAETTTLNCMTVFSVF